MKSLNKILFFLLIPFFFGGCYTVIWTPEEDFPDESNYESYDNDTYYGEEYYYYYDYPWWLTIAPPTHNRTDEKYKRDGSVSDIRNNGNGRNNPDRKEILETPPPTRSSNTNNDSNSSSTKTESKRTESDSSNNSNDNSRNSSNSSNSNTRNNDGSRNNGRSR